MAYQSFKLLCFSFLYGTSLLFQLADCLSFRYTAGNCTEPGTLKRSDGNKPLLWKIEKNPPSYLFGTIHVPYTEVWDEIKDDVVTAFKSTTKLFIEIDLKKQGAQDAFSSCVMSSNNKSKSSHSEPETGTDRVRKRTKCS